MSTYPGRIERGRIAADILGHNFTTVFNAAIRDRRISRRARGLLTELLSHRDGFGISVAALVAAGPEGKTAITTALNELETYGYLVRDRERDEKGRLGDAVYRVTDMPEGLHITAAPPYGKTPSSQPESGNPPQDDAGKNTRSEPVSGLPPQDDPAQGDPAQDNPPHKKTTSKKTTVEEDQSLSPAPEEPPVPTAQTTGESETITDHDTDPDDTPGSPAAQAAEEVLQAYKDAYRALHNVEPLSRNVQVEATALLTAPTPWPLDHLKRLAAELPHRGYTSLTRHAEHNPPPSPARIPKQLPPPCAEHIGPDLPMRTVTTDTGELRKCPRCHPYSPVYEGPA